MFVGAILAVLIVASALLAIISGVPINYSAVPMLVKLWVAMSLVLPLILVGVPLLVAALSSLIKRVFK